MSNVVMAVILIILILLSAFFSMTEIAFSSADKYKLKTNYDGNKKKYAIVYELSEKLDESISTILVGNNLVNIAATSISTILFIRLFGDELGPIYSTIVITVAILIFGEIFPKLIGGKSANKLIYVLAYPLMIFKYVFFIVTYPVNTIINKFRKHWYKEDDTPSLTDEELIDIVQQIEDQGDIDEDKSDLIQNAIEFKDVSAYEAMTPRVDIIGFDIEDDPNEFKFNNELTAHSYIPVYEESLDNIIGIVSSKQIMKMIVLKEKIVIKQILRPILFVNETKSIEDILQEMSKNKIKMAVVLDEFGGTDGILTKENILEELVGDIWDEKDKIEEDYKELSKNEYLINGDMNIDDLLDLLSVDIPNFESDYATVGGWCSEKLDKIPSPNDSFKFENYRFTIKRVIDNRVEEIHAKKILTRKKK